ncbi:MAG: N,N-dimethylformamidase beta subunit family domain-containing protein [Vicinamibacterales bacterium]
MKRTNSRGALAAAGLALLTWGSLGHQAVSAQGRAGGAAPAAQAAPADPCAAPANKIIAENCRPGNPSTEWDINGWGDPSIQGFATDISYNLGQTAEFKILTPSSKYRIDVYRMGYYGGLGARLMGTVRPSVTLPQRQPACLEDWSVRLYDCGNWAVSATWAIPSDAISGVYVARLVREDAPPVGWRVDNAPGGGAKPEAVPHAYGALGLGKNENALKEPRASHIIFIVRDEASKSDVVMQTSDPTWQAYNTYGLGSSYNGLTSTGASGGRVARANKVSFNRPFLNRTSGSVNQFFNAEYALARWLERNGYDTSYMAGVDTDRRGELLKNHKLYISIGHDEYWSMGARRNVEAARDAGLNLAFLSGNEVFWKIRYENSLDASKTPYRTLVVYKETHSTDTPTNELQPGKSIDPTDIWTGTWRESSPYNPEGAMPENGLTGTIFTVNANRQDPLLVPERFAKHRFWRNTEVAQLKPGETAVIGNGILGHEWDEDLDNGFRPAGLIKLSETTMDGVPYPIDWGTVYDAGTATHNLVLHRVKSGALVFGCGCVQYSWGLDDFHDNATSVRDNRSNPLSTRVVKDPYGTSRALQQATVNLFADMGIQPKNLQRDLTPATPSTDKLRPISKIVTPAAKAAVPAGSITVSGTASDAGGGLVAGVEVSLDGGKTWHPAAGTTQWTYTGTIPAGTPSSTIMSRATDDSVNMEVPGKGVVVTHGSPTAVR